MRRYIRSLLVGPVLAGALAACDSDPTEPRLDMPVLAPIDMPVSPEPGGKPEIDDRLLLLKQ